MLFYTEKPSYSKDLSVFIWFYPAHYRLGFYTTHNVSLFLDILFSTLSNILLLYQNHKTFSV